MIATGQQMPRDRDTPLPIVGAGPAGLACAIVLARGGQKVIVHDRRKRPGGRFHGDFQGIENWTSSDDIMKWLMQAGIEATFDYIPVYKGVAFDAWGKAYRVGSDKPLYYLVRRGASDGTLDQGLLQQARDLGVEVRFNSPVHKIEAPAVLAIGPRTADAIAAGYVFETDMADGQWICFNNALAPLGYSYLLVAGGRGTVASCMFTGFKQQQQYVARTVRFFEDKAGLRMNNPRPFGGYGNFRLPRTAVQGGKPVVGEHAGFQDSLAGFGMVFAMRSGILAARSLLEGRDYCRMWRKELLPLLHTAVSNRFLFALVGERGRRWALSGQISKGDTREVLHRIYHPSLLTRLVLPLALWRYRAPLQDKSCDHVSCTCVWCQHGVNHAAIEAC